MRQDATVAIPTMDPHLPDFRECLRGALAARRPVIVIDMSSGDGVKTECARQSGARYHAAPDSSGLSDSRNRALARAETDLIVFLDSDAFPRGDWVTPLIRRLDDPSVGVVGARVLPRWSRSPSPLFRSTIAEFWLSGLDLGDTPLEVPRVVGTSFAFHRGRTPPSFKEELGLHPGDKLGGDEVDFC